jgi:hypothetical protein
MQYLVGIINHNADLLEQHIDGGVYVHRQAEPATVWPANHALGSLRPLIETYDSDGHRIGHSVNRETQTKDYCAIMFAIPMSGTAILRP